MIRKAEPADLDELVRLCAEHARFEGAVIDTAGLRDRLAALIFAQEPRLFAWVVDPGDGRLAGYATAAEELSTWRGRTYLHLDCLYLEPQLRGRGVGRRLMEAVLAYARERGLSEMEWQTPAWNAEAISFYRRFGARPADKVRFLLGSSSPASA